MGTIDEYFAEMAKGMKEKDGKLLMYEVDSRFIQDMGKVMSKNKDKYPRGNHYKPIDKIFLLEAMERHLLKVKEHFQYGTDLIDDDGCSHLTKIACNSMMLQIQLDKYDTE